MHQGLPSRAVCSMLLIVLLVQGSSTQTFMPIFRLFATLGLVIVLLSDYANAATALKSSAQHIYIAEDQQVLPHRYANIPHWLDSLTEVNRVALTGGSYWLVKQLNIQQADQWLASVDGPNIENIDYYLYSEGNQLRHLSSGYLHPYEYLFSYARHIDTPTLGGYWLIARVSSHYYTEQPQLNFAPKAELGQLYHQRASLITLCLGALLILAIYNGAVSIVQQDKVFALFSAYLLAITISLALVFQVTVHLFNLRALSIQLLPLLTIPVFSVLFYSRFLDLQRYSPRLWLISRYLIALCLLAIPATTIWLNYTVVIIFNLILLWITLTLVSAMVCWRKGSEQARSFILPTLLLIVPALLIVLSVIPKDTTTLLATDILLLLCCTLSGLSMSLALHYKFKRLVLESLKVNQQLNLERDAARLDALTGLQNRYAFNEYVSQQLTFTGEQNCCLALIDIDYLKIVNDQSGHQEGDRLIKLAAEALNMVLTDRVELFRIGGDEFAVFSSQLSASELQEKLSIVDKVIQLNGAAHSGISFGCANTNSCRDAEQLFYRADMTMYQQKAQRKSKAKLVVAPSYP